VSSPAHAPAAKGNLVLVWYRPEERVQFRGVLPPGELVHALLERARVIRDVRLDQPGGIAYSLEHSGGDVSVFALFDHQHAFWPTMFGAGSGNLIGVSEPAARDVVLEPIPAEPPKPERCTGQRLELFEIDAPALAASGRVRERLCVRLPASYATRPQQRYPVVFLLPGLSSSDTTYLHGKKDLGPIADALAAEGKPEVILVGVDTSTRHGSTYFTDSPTGGAWQSFVPRMIAEVDARYRTDARRESRAVIGNSTGGFNAIHLALSFPEHFWAVGASAPDALDLEGWLFEDGGKVRDQWLAWARLEDAMGGMGQLVSYSVAWSADPGSARGYRFPFDLESGRPNDDWQRWRAQSPLVWLEDDQRRHAIQRALSGRIFLTVGANDEFSLFPPTRRFAERLKELGIGHELVVSKGGHFSDGALGSQAALAFVVRSFKGT
jgi:enterochelin esterase-like enzyme